MDTRFSKNDLVQNAILRLHYSSIEHDPLPDHDPRDEQTVNFFSPSPVLIR